MRLIAVLAVALTLLFVGDARANPYFADDVAYALTGEGAVSGRAAGGALGALGGGALGLITGGTLGVVALVPFVSAGVRTGLAGSSPCTTFGAAGCSSAPGGSGLLLLVPVGAAVGGLAGAAGGGAVGFALGPVLEE